MLDFVGFHQQRLNRAFPARHVARDPGTKRSDVRVSSSFPFIWILFFCFFCVSSQVELELESVRKQQSSVAESNLGMVKEEVLLLRYRDTHTHTHALHST